MKWTRGDHVCKTTLISPNSAGIYDLKKVGAMKIMCTMYMKKKTVQAKQSEISIRTKTDEVTLHYAQSTYHVHTNVHIMYYTFMHYFNMSLTIIHFISSLFIPLYVSVYLVYSASWLY